MPIPEDETEFLQQIFTIVKMGLIPVKLVVFDRKTEEMIDEYFVGCHAVPRQGEVIDYGETQLGVVNVRHEFQAGRFFQGTQMRMQIITVGCYVDLE